MNEKVEIISKETLELVKLLKRPDVQGVIASGRRTRRHLSQAFRLAYYTDTIEQQEIKQLHQ